jgi:hypothetical protein
MKSDNRIWKNRFKIIVLLFICVLILFLIPFAHAVSIKEIREYKNTPNDKLTETKNVFPLIQLNNLNNTQSFYLFSINQTNITVINLNDNFTEIKIGKYIFSKKTSPSIIPTLIIDNMTEELIP